MVMEVCSNDAPASVTALPSQMWQRSRHWFAPAAHALLTRFSGSGDSVHFACLLEHPGLASLGDCNLKGMQSLPAAVLVEVYLSEERRCYRDCAGLPWP